ncbi:hypothetical protein HMPREF3293_01442 [Christensenella minuta]|uniref:Uncharacterized protein n=1 Tax=Christensenella minuta TaxID=626937 RepID=A0A136Q4Z1_9FIRM|nr:hypothetical protein HMPREF3293_01442 [Christensenella minuta]
MRCPANIYYHHHQIAFKISTVLCNKLYNRISISPSYKKKFKKIK